MRGNAKKRNMAAFENYNTTSAIIWKIITLLALRYTVLLAEQSLSFFNCNAARL